VFTDPAGRCALVVAATVARFTPAAKPTGFDGGGGRSGGGGASGEF
jgi:uncharacterized membrane protein YgcG